MQSFSFVVRVYDKASSERENGIYLLIMTGKKIDLRSQNYLRKKRKIQVIDSQRRKKRGEE